MPEYIEKEEFEVFQTHVLNQIKDIFALFNRQQAHMERYLECTEKTQKHMDHFMARMDHLCQFIQSVSDSVDSKDKKGEHSCH